MISFRTSAYQKLCVRHGIREAADQELLARFLHDLGVMLNYSDRMPLENTHILNPRWVTDGVYALVLSDELKAAGGILTGSLMAAWKD